jgi:hypothetical protein
MLQSSVAWAGLRAMLVIIQPNRVARLTFKRPSINAVSSSRVRCEAGILAMGCSLAGLAKARLLNQNQICKGCTPPIFQQF